MFYHQDPQNPDKVDSTRHPYEDVHFVQTGGPLVMPTIFSMDVTYFLLPASDYIVFLSAFTEAGDGPKARMSFTTARTGDWRYKCLYWPLIIQAHTFL